MFKPFVIFEIASGFHFISNNLERLHTPLHTESIVSYNAV